MAKVRNLQSKFVTAERCAVMEVRKKEGFLVSHIWTSPSSCAEANKYELCRFHLLFPNIHPDQFGYLYIFISDIQKKKQFRKITPNTQHIVKLSTYIYIFTSAHPHIDTQRERREWKTKRQRQTEKRPLLW